MRKKWLLSQPTCDLPERIDGIACKAQILKRSESDPFTWILNIDIYNFGTLKGRYFADRYMREYASCIKGIWRQTNILNTIDIVRNGVLDSTTANGYYRYSDTGRKHFDTDEDYELAESYMGVYLTDWEREINSDRRTTAWKRKVDRIDDLMAQVPEAPVDMEAWVRGKAFSEEYLMLKSEGDKRNAYCTACGEEWETEKKFRLGSMAQCPACRQRLKVKRSNEFSKTVPAILLQPFLGNWIERIFRATAFYKFGTRPQIELYEDIRIVIPKGDTWGKCYYGQHGDADETMQDWWDANQHNKRFRKGLLYTRNLEDIRGIAPESLFRSGIRELADQGAFDVNKFIYSFDSRPYMEYLIKGRFYSLAADILDTYTWAGRGACFVPTPDCINGDGRKVTEVLRLDKNHVNRLRVMDGGTTMLEWLQFDQWEGYRVTDEALEFFEKSNLRVKDLESLIEEVGSVTKVANYIRKQEYKPSTFIQYWKDYLRMAEAEGYDTSDSIVRFPKNLKRRHDEILEVINERQRQKDMAARAEKNKAINARIVKQLPKARRLFWENDRYMFIPAGTAEELEQEGRTLHHCVGSSPIYKENMAAGTSWILFLRKKEDVQKPYYTIEISMSDDKILQYYSEFDRQPDKEEISKLLTEYKRYLKKTPRPEVVVDLHPTVLETAI